MKTFCILALFSLFLISCGGDTPTEEPVSEELKQEITTLETENEELEEIKADIDESSEELDKLLDEL